MPTTVNCTSYFAGANPISISPTRTNTSPTKNGCYSGHVTLEELAKKELLRRMENLKFCNGKRFSNDNPIQLFRQIPQQRAGNTRREFQQGGMVKKREILSHECSRDISTKMFKPKLFTKNMSNLTIKVQVENRVALAYLFKGMQQTPDSKLPQNVFLKITKF